MTLEAAVARARSSFDSGDFREILARRIAMPTESQKPERNAILRQYLEQEIGPSFGTMGFSWRLIEHPKAKAPFLFAERIEGPDVPTMASYGHGDVVRGLDSEWDEGLSPWELKERNGRWYGRGVADSKGQHTINMEAMRYVLATRGRLGFNAKFLIEMGEEINSPGLRELCAELRTAMKADVMISSDGARMSPDRPTISLGTRGGVNFDLRIEAREKACHSGNWGGLVSNPGIQLAHAISTIASATGQIRIPEWVPSELPASVRRALADAEIDGGSDGPEVEPWWGESGLRPVERIYGWSSFEVLAFKTGNPENPMNAIPPRAWARCQLRFAFGVDPVQIMPALRRHLDRQGFPMVKAVITEDGMDFASRLDPDEDWVKWTVASIARSTGKKPSVRPSSGASSCNDAFTGLLGQRSIWVPHSYGGCSQHAPNEHLPIGLLREGLKMMTSLFWDLGSGGTPTARA
ncbi:M20 family metallopeptidase [Bradyrhizobium sp. 177]|uniref:M20 family metallopeptidase n=1 Tax=Bradyrhizobium sp. 177 TaxID=2782647 RepID=UPI001FFAB67C|nr:M20 family metallopeptidase [Bradyrhizobium sp. 177]MCK1552532.1 M20 family metallopeptidase [Bradyrhizobium sp. 177]